ncbi:hypothetical protein [Paenibacillus xylaniclasticus]|uniref:hypothetical protein n=1 Tax=Paenibacillus xylaniclasticus TaxID=588083 RepID=UPI000FDB559F|nr:MULTISPECIES: hypothetical protein [Paenibacillus]GFN32310.1 hypothetical protein PCURB6_25700 [Paenibacillus curdlanolyticus]
MPAKLLDYKVSQPSNGEPGGVLPGGVQLPYVLASSNSIILADVGIYLSSGPPNRIELGITVGLGHPQNDKIEMTIEFLRDEGVIWIGRYELPGVNDFEVNELHLITTMGADFNAPAGFHVYKCRLTPITSGIVRIDGPVTLSGTAYAMT